MLNVVAELKRFPNLYPGHNLLPPACHREKHRYKLGCPLSPFLVYLKAGTPTEVKEGRYLLDVKSQFGDTYVRIYAG